MKNTLVKVRAGLAALTTVGLLTIVGALPATAGAPPLQVDPTSVHAGDTVNANGGCTDSNLDLLLYAGSNPSYGEPAGDPIKTTSSVDRGQNGNWTGSIVVPTGSDPGQYTVSAHCYGEGTLYQNAVITVLPDATTTTTTTTTTPSTTTTSVPAAPPAPMVQATPTYTG